MIISRNAALIDRNDREAPDLVRFADGLKELHRLGTTSYESLSDAFQDHLRTGRRLFGSPMGMIVRAEADTTALLAVDGDTPAVSPRSAHRMESPIMLGGEMVATLSFSSGPERAERDLSPEEHGLSEVM